VVAAEARVDERADEVGVFLLEGEVDSLADLGNTAQTQGTAEVLRLGGGG